MKYLVGAGVFSAAVIAILSSLGPDGLPEWFYEVENLIPNPFNAFAEVTNVT